MSGRNYLLGRRDVHYARRRREVFIVVVIHGRRITVYRPTRVVLVFYWQRAMITTVMGIRVIASDRIVVMLRSAPEVKLDSDRFY